MANLVFANNAITTLGSVAGSGDTTITVASGTGALFPNPVGGQAFTATLIASGSITGTPNEIVLVTARSGDTMTVVRAQEGTSARSWSIGDTFANFPTAQFFNGASDQSYIQSQTGNSANDAGTANAGVITLSPVPASLAALYLAPIRVEKIASANTGPYTLNVNGLGAKNVLLNGNPIQPGQLPGLQVFEVVWDGTSFELISPPSGVANINLATMGAGTVKGNNTGGTTVPQDIPFSTLRSAIGAQPIAITTSGPGQFGSLIPDTGAGTITVPGGGTWQWFFMNNGASSQGISAGGTVVFTGLINNFGSWCTRLV